MRKVLPAIVGAAFIVSFGIVHKPHVAQAAKVDCDKVMSELNGGKKAAEVADDLKISTSSVYRCRRKAHKAGASSAAASPMAAPSTAHTTAPKH